MKRQGRQRGMVLTYPVVSSGRNQVNELSSPPTAGLLTKAPSKPTNHSKFTGRCGRPKCRDCRIEPAWKLKCKAKGTHRTRSTALDVGLNAAVGFSAIDVLEDYLDDS